MDAAAIARLLPEIYRGSEPGGAPGSVLDSVLAVMQEMHAPAEVALADLDRLFDPRRAPEALLLHVAAWVGLEPYLDEREAGPSESRRRFAIDSGNLRELTARASDFARLRGTRGTLLTMLEIATGVRGFEIDENPPGEDGRPLAFHFRLRAPLQAQRYRDIVTRIVNREKPAYTTAEILFAGN